MKLDNFPQYDIYYNKICNFSDSKKCKRVKDLVTSDLIPR